jgi:hypothetical protein
MENIFVSPGVYTTETNSDYWLPPELMKDLRQSGLSMSRRMKISKIFKDESLYPVMKDIIKANPPNTFGPIGSNGPIGTAGISGNPS